VGLPKSTKERKDPVTSRRRARRCVTLSESVGSALHTRGQAQFGSRGHQGSSVDHPSQLIYLFESKFWHVWNLLPQSIGLGVSVLRHYQLETVKSVIDVQMEKMKQLHLSLPYDHRPVTQHA